MADASVAASGFRPSRQPPPFLPASMAFLPPGTPSTSIAKAETPRSNRTPKGDSSRGGRTSRSTLSSRTGKRAEDIQNKSRSEAREAPDARIEMTAAMQTLFNTFDVDGSGSIDLDEFVKVQGIASQLYGLPGAPVKQGLVEQYLQARAPGEVQQYGGGLGFEGFVRWQLQWQAPFWVTGEEMEISERCRKLGEHIKSKRSSSQSSRSQRMTPRHRPRPRSPWPPQAPSAKAAPRPPRSARKYASGGGMATAAKGFVQPPVEVAFDLDTYEEEFNLKEESSDDEAYREKKLAEAALVQEEADEVCFIAETDVRSNVLAERLHLARLQFFEALVQSQREACRAKEKNILEEMQKLVISLAERRLGEMVLRGSVVCGQAVLQASRLELQDVAAGSKTGAKSSSEGIFKVSTAVSPQKDGSNHLLVTRHRGAAPLYRKMAGEGLKRCRMEMLPLQAWYFQASATERILFEDKHSGARFRIPALLKAGQAFAGKAKLSYALVLPDYGSMSRPVIKLKRRDNARDFAQAEASRVAAMAVAAVPERHGRSMGGSQVPLLLAAAAFARLCDAEDGEELDVAADGKLEVFLPCHSLALHALEVGTAPSIWSFREEHAEWCQTPQLLRCNNKELPLPRQPEAEIRSSLEKSSAQTSRPDAAAGCRAEQESLQAAEIRRGHEAWIRQQRREPQAHLEGVCYCGFRSKEAILHHFRTSRRELRWADPPKRLFAGVQPDETGFHQIFPYRTQDDIIASAERAAMHPEVVVSHHLTAAARLLDPCPEMAKDMGLSSASLFTFRHYDQISGRVLPHLRHLASFLVEGARAIHSVKGDDLVQVAKMAIKMTALEFMVNCWIRPRKANSAPCTVQELWEALKARGGDVATAFLYVALQQANRDSMATLRKQLRHRNPSLWASYDELLPALHGQSLETLAHQFQSRADIQALQDLVYQRGGRCRRMSLAAALAERPSLVQAAQQRQAALVAAAKEARATEEKANKGWATSMRNLKRALINNDLSQQLDESKATKELAALAKKKKEEAERLTEEASQAQQEAEMEQSMQAPADRLAEDKSSAQEILQSDDVEEAWKEVLAGVAPALWEYGYPKALTFSFEVPQLGQWHAVGLAEAPDVPFEETRSKELSQFDLNFFSELPLPVQPVLRASAMALGIFDGHEAKMLAVEVAAGAMGSSGMSWSQVEADGTFCIYVTAFRAFELWLTLSDTSRPPLRFGPFMARSCDEVTHLGTLRPSYATKPGEWRNPVLPAGAFIMLPRVEVGGTAHERCSCDAQAFLEGTETSTEELSKELSKELSRQEASIET